MVLLLFLDNCCFENKCGSAVVVFLVNLIDSNGLFNVRGIKDEVAVNNWVCCIAVASAGSDVVSSTSDDLRLQMIFLFVCF